MQPVSRRFPRVLIICGFIAASTGCSSTIPPSDNSAGLVGPASEGTPSGPKALEMLWAEVARLRVAARESFDAVTVIGTPEAQLAEARAALEHAEQLIQDGQAAAARDAQEGRRQLRAAGSALRRAEEAAIRAGLSHIEQEMAKGYAQVLTPKFGARRHLLGMGRVTQGIAHLRGGAGIDFQIVGKVREGEPLNLMAEVGNWYHVRTQGGIEGWVAKDLITREPDL
jgi:hypothetical protein